MDVKLLINSVMRQTTVLIAELATAAGVRAPLSHLADQVFLELSRELEGQGVTRKVAADMFGLALRSYQLKVQRLEESLTDESISLWEAVFGYIQEHTMVGRSEVLHRFRYDDESSVKSILYDLVQSGLVFQTGSGNSITYRAASGEERGAITEREARASAPWTVWVAVYRDGPITRDALLASLRLDAEVLDDALTQLRSDGSITAVEEDGTTFLDAEHCVIPMDQTAGWEAALFDHFNAVVGAIANKLRQLELRTQPADTIGGSTYSFDLWEGHPHAEEVVGLLRETRERISALRQKVTAANESEERDGKPANRRVTFYVGQSVIDNGDAS